MSLRQYLSSVVLSCFQNDNVLQSLFVFEGITCKDWCDSIVIDGRWTSTFDVIVFAYLMKVNVIAVGNYLNGFTIQSARNSVFIINPYLDVASQQYIPEEPKVVHLYFHMHLYPLVGETLGNHFVYLEPLSTCNLDLKVKSIRYVGSQLSQVDVKHKQKKKTVNA